MMNRQPAIIDSTLREACVYKKEDVDSFSRERMGHEVDEVCSLRLAFTHHFEVLQCEEEREWRGSVTASGQGGEKKERLGFISKA